MRNKFVQMSLNDIYNDVTSTIEQQESSFLSMTDEYIDFSALIPSAFYMAFYKNTGRKHDNSLESYIRALFLQKFVGFDKVTQLLILLHMSPSAYQFCGFYRMPNEPEISRFKSHYVEYIKALFESLVDITEPIAREIDAKKADYLLFDTTGFEIKIAENNPKFFISKLNAAKAIAKKNPKCDPYKFVYSLFPDTSQYCSDAKLQYINGHFCYAVKAAFITNGLGIIRHISIFDNDFKSEHPDIVESKTDKPDADKEIGDSTALEPVLDDFFKVHPQLSYKTFIGDASFDKYDHYSMLKNEFGFDRVCVPLNPRNSKPDNNTDTKPAEVPFDKNGIPLCPIDKTPFISLGKSKGRHRSTRFKFVCPKSERHGRARICTCDTPCTSSSYGRCVYTYPDKDFRQYPGIIRGTGHWNNLYKHRVNIERTINLVKDTFGTACHRSCSVKTLKADIYMAGIVHLLGVIIASEIKRPELFKSVRKLIAS